jgi:ketosteroid isomerase-like protein
MHQIYAPELSDLSPLTRSDTATSQGLKATEYKSLSGDSRSALPDYSTDNETIRNRIDNWADAWSNRDLDRYLSYYSSEFVPRYNLTLDQWKKHQHALWRWRKLIVVELSDVSIDISGNDAIVKFTQHYKSNSFENTVGKTLELKQKNGSWYITREFI